LKKSLTSSACVCCSETIHGPVFPQILRTFFVFSHLVYHQEKMNSNHDDGHVFAEMF